MSDLARIAVDLRDGKIDKSEFLQKLTEKAISNFEPKTIDAFGSKRQTTDPIGPMLYKINEMLKGSPYELKVDESYTSLEKGKIDFSLVDKRGNVSDKASVQLSDSAKHSLQWRHLSQTNG